MNTFTSNIAKLSTTKLSIVKAALAAFVLVASSFAHAGTTLETVTDNYLYESLIQAEFDIENHMQASVEQSSTETFQQVLMATNAVTENEQIENAQISKELAE